MVIKSESPFFLNLEVPYETVWNRGIGNLSFSRNKLQCVTKYQNEKQNMFAISYVILNRPNQHRLGLYLVYKYLHFDKGNCYIHQSR